MRKWQTLVIALLFLPGVLAETQSFTTNINVTNSGSLNGTFNIKAESGVDRSYSCNSTFSDSIGITINRNVTCSTSSQESLLQNFTKVCLEVMEQQKSVLAVVNGTDVLASGYTKCTQEKDLFLTNATIFHKDFITCENELNSIKGEITNLRDKESSLNSQLTSCTTTKVDPNKCLIEKTNPICQQIALNVQGGTWTKYAVGIAIGIAAMWIYNRNQQNKKGRTPVSSGPVPGFAMPPKT